MKSRKPKQWWRVNVSTDHDAWRVNVSGASFRTAAQRGMKALETQCGLRRKNVTEVHVRIRRIASSTDDT